MPEVGIGVIEKPKIEKTINQPPEVEAIKRVWNMVDPSLKALKESNKENISLEGIAQQDIEALFVVQGIRDITKKPDKILVEDDGWVRAVRDFDPRYLHLELLPPEDKQDEGMVIVHYFDTRNNPYEPKEDIIFDYNNNVRDIHKRITLSLLYPNNKGENLHGNYMMIVASRSLKDLEEKYTITSEVDSSGKTMWKIEKPPEKQNA